MLKNVVRVPVCKCIISECSKNHLKRAHVIGNAIRIRIMYTYKYISFAIRDVHTCTNDLEFLYDEHEYIGKELLI